MGWTIRALDCLQAGLVRSRTMEAGTNGTHHPNDQWQADRTVAYYVLWWPLIAVGVLMAAVISRRLCLDRHSESVEDEACRKEKRARQASMSALFRRHSRVKEANETGIVEECVLCLEELAAGDQIISLPCSPYPHEFHAHCIARWFNTPEFKSLCPLCKQDPCVAKISKIAVELCNAVAAPECLESQSQSEVPNGNAVAPLEVASARRPPAHGRSASVPVDVESSYGLGF